MTDNGRDLRGRLPDIMEHGIIPFAREGAADGFNLAGVQLANLDACLLATNFQLLWEATCILRYVRQRPPSEVPRICQD